MGQQGLFKIVSEGGVAAGVRRLEAATGLNALGHLRGLDLQLQRAAKAMRSGAADVVDKIEKLVERDRALEKEVADLKKKLVMGGGGATGGSTAGSNGGLDERLKAAREINGPGGVTGRAIALRFDGTDAATLRELAEQVRDKLGEAVVLVGAETGGKVALVCTVSKGLLGQFKAGDLVKASAAVVGGSGGGRPDMAQAGGTDVTKIDEALDQLYKSVGLS